MSASGKWFVSVCYSYEISGITPAPITKNLKGIGLDYSSPYSSTIKDEPPTNS